MIDGDEEPNTIGAAGVRTFSQCDERRTPRLRPLVTAITATLVAVPLAAAHGPKYDHLLRRAPENRLAEVTLPRSAQNRAKWVVQAVSG